jgi:hypothetical protein
MYSMGHAAYQCHALQSEVLGYYSQDPVLRASGARGPVQIVPSAFARHHMMGVFWFVLRIITLRCPLNGISLSWNPSLPFTYRLACLQTAPTNVFPASPAQRYHAQASRTRPSRSSRFGRCWLAIIPDTRAAPGPEITKGKKGKESVRVTREPTVRIRHGQMHEHDDTGAS